MARVQSELMEEEKSVKAVADRTEDGMLTGNLGILGIVLMQTLFHLLRAVGGGGGGGGCMDLLILPFRMTEIAA